MPARGQEVCLGDIVSVSFFDTLNPNQIETVTFKAKSGITTSNPTQFLITLTGMANHNETIRFNDTVPIIKDVLVEPAYIDYEISLEYTSPIVKNEEKAIDVRIASSMGRFYDHLRLIAEVTEPSGATMRLLGIDNEGLEHDVILSGWGPAAGFGLGGAVNEVYHFKGIFSEDGDYVLTLKLIDRDDSDKVIASKTTTIKVGNEVMGVGGSEELPSELPKTGMNFSLYLVISIFSILAVYTVANRKNY